MPSARALRGSNSSAAIGAAAATVSTRFTTAPRLDLRVRFADLGRDFEGVAVITRVLRHFHSHAVLVVTAYFAEVRLNRR